MVIYCYISPWKGFDLNSASGSELEILRAEEWREEAAKLPLEASSPVPLHAQLQEAIATLLDRAVWRTGEQIPGQRDLADQFNVSPLTMNKALSSLVGEGRLERRRGLGTFVATPVAEVSSLRLAVVFHRPDESAKAGSYLGEIIHGVNNALSPLGFAHSVNFVADWNPQAVASLSQPEVDGILLIAPPSERWADIEYLSGRGKQVVVVGAWWPESLVPMVSTDNEGGMRLGLDHLLGLGHRRIACAVAPVKYSDQRNRSRAFREILVERGVPVRPEHVVERWDPTQESGRADIYAILDSPNRPSALVTLDVTVAALALSVARELSISVPDDLSIVTFDDTPLAVLLDPPLTAIGQPLEQMGEMATRMLIAHCSGTASSAMHTVVPMHLVVRASSAPPRTGPARSIRAALPQQTLLAKGSGKLRKKRPNLMVVPSIRRS